MRKILNIFSNNGGMTLIKKYFYNIDHEVLKGFLTFDLNLSSKI